MSIKKTILVVEDDGYISNVLETLLHANGYQAITAPSGTAALSLAASHMPDLVLLDLSLPDIDGLEVLAQLRKWSVCPVIVVSARTREKEKVTALDLGADDYVTKPFGAEELLARIRTALRRQLRNNGGDARPATSYTVGGLTIDFEKYRVLLDGEDVHLTQVEYKIIELIAGQPGSVFTYDRIMKSIWGPYAAVGDNRILRVNMANIRRKIEKNHVRPKYIHTEIGVGYRMTDRVEE